MFEHLSHERRIYRQLLPLQGNHVPVCLGMMKLRQVYYYSGAQLSHLLLMSWGGRPVPAPANREYRARFPTNGALLRTGCDKLGRHGSVFDRDMRATEKRFDSLFRMALTDNTKSTASLEIGLAVVSLSSLPTPRWPRRIP